jgi:ATP-binding cassette, subfamily B, bacterial
MKRKQPFQLKKTSMQGGLRVGLRTLISNSIWTLQYSFQRNPFLIFSLLVLALASSAMPALLAISTRGLVNTVMESVRGISSDSNRVLLWLGVGLVAAILDAILSLAEDYLSSLFQDAIGRSITLDVLDHISKLDLAQLEDLQFQDTMSLVQQNIGSAFTRFLSNLINLTSIILVSIFLLALLFQIDWIILPLFLPILGFYLWFEWNHVVRKTELEQIRTTKRRWTTYFTLRLTTPQFLPEVKLLGLPPLMLRKFDTLLKEFIKQDQDIRKSALVMQLIYSLVTSGLVTIILYRIVRQIQERVLTIGDLTIFGGAALRLRRNIELTVLNAGTALESAIYITHVRNLFNMPAKLRTEQPTPSDPVRGELKVDHVTFFYPGASTPALNKVSLDIHKGEVVALVGENGAGKTTLAKLLAGLYAPSDGKIFLDSQDLQAYNSEYLFHQFSFIFQPYGKYEGTVHENIAYGDWTKLLQDPDRVKEIGRKCGIDPMIQKLPQQYDTLLGRMFGQVDLSGGQWQKVAIARAFARDASILILDEPTSSLDPRAEYEIFCMFRALAQNRTTIIISHRFSTVSMADRIVVLDNGTIVEQGSHQELMRLNTTYAAMYNMQAKQMDSLRKGE